MAVHIAEELYATDRILPCSSHKPRLGRARTRDSVRKQLKAPTTDNPTVPRQGGTICGELRVAFRHRGNASNANPLTTLLPDGGVATADVEGVYRRDHSSLGIRPVADRRCSHLLQFVTNHADFCEFSQSAELETMFKMRSTCRVSIIIFCSAR